MSEKGRGKICQNCIYWDENSSGVMTLPCVKHPFYFRNENGDCFDYKKKWWKFWIKE